MPSISVSYGTAALHRISKARGLSRAGGAGRAGHGENVVRYLRISHLPSPERRGIPRGSDGSRGIVFAPRRPVFLADQESAAQRASQSPGQSAVAAIIRR